MLNVSICIKYEMKKKDKDLEGGQQLPCTLRNMDLEKCP